MTGRRLQIKDEGKPAEQVFRIADMDSKLIVGEVARSCGIKAFVPKRSRTSLVVTCTDEKASEIQRLSSTMILEYKVQCYKAMAAVFERHNLGVPDALINVTKKIETELCKEFNRKEGESL